jgi:hypothetical protein
MTARMNEKLLKSFNRRKYEYREKLFFRYNEKGILDDIP